MILLGNIIKIIMIWALIGLEIITGYKLLRKKYIERFYTILISDKTIYLLNNFYR